jgi:hypothetical protein
MQPLRFLLELQTMSALASVLTHAARLGGEITYLEAHAGRVQVHLLSPPQCVHRFAPQLERIVEVVSLEQLPIEEVESRELAA